MLQLLRIFRVVCFLHLPAVTSIYMSFGQQEKDQNEKGGKGRVWYPRGKGKISKTNFKNVK